MLLRNLLALVWAHLKVGVRVYGVNRMATHRLIAELEELSGVKEAISKADRRRLHLYTAIGRLVTDAMATLLGHRLKAAQKQHTLYLSALSPWIDDLADEEGWSSEQIRDWLNFRMERTSPQAAAIFAQHLTQRLANGMGEYFPRLESYAAKLLDAQEASQRQLGPEQLSEATLRDLTFQKGATSLWVYRSIIPLPISPEEEHAIGQMGYLIQLTNDLFDVYKDREKQQQTLFTNEPDLALRREEYLNLYHDLREKFHGIAVSKRRFRSFFAEMTPIVSRALVCFDQLQALQGGAPTFSNLEQYSRQELVCDMEKVGNIWASLRYGVRLNIR